MFIYPSHGYTVLAADEIFKKYQAILACSAVLIHVNPIWPLGRIDAEAPLGHIDAEAPLGYIDGKADDQTIQQVGSTSQMHKSL